MSRRVQFVVGTLVVLAAAGMLVTWILKGRALQDRVGCQNHIRLLYMASATDLADGADRRLRAEVPAGTLYLDGVPPERRLSWLVPALPAYPVRGTDTAALLASFDRKQPADADKNREAGRTVLKTLFCPGAVPAEMMPVTHYVGIAGLGADAGTLPVGDPRSGAWRYDGPTPQAALTDGLSQTLLFAETLTGGPWAVGGPGTVRGVDDRPLFGAGGQFGAGHADGLNIGLADGSGRYVTFGVSPEYFRRLATGAGGVGEVE